MALAFAERLDGFITALIADKAQRAAVRTAIFPQGRASLGEAKVDELPLLPGEEQTFALAALGAGTWLVARNAGPRKLRLTATLE